MQAPVGLWDPGGLSADGNAENFKHRRLTELKHRCMSMLAARGLHHAGDHWQVSWLLVPICQFTRLRLCELSRTSLGCRLICRWQRGEFRALSPDRAQTRAHSLHVGGDGVHHAWKNFMRRRQTELKHRRLAWWRRRVFITPEITVKPPGVLSPSASFTRLRP